MKTEQLKSSLGLVQKQIRIFRYNSHHPGPLPLASAEPPAQPGSDGRGRIGLRRLACPTAPEAARDGSGYSLSRWTGEGQGEGGFFRNLPPVRHVFRHKPLTLIKQPVTWPVVPATRGLPGRRRLGLCGMALLLALGALLARAHVVPPEQFHPVVESYRRLTFLLNLNPVLWDEVKTDADRVAMGWR